MSATLGELTAFQRDCIRVVAKNQPCKGVTISNQLQDKYNGSIQSSRLYPNLNELTDMGLLEKGSRDGRTSEYELSKEGEELVEIFLKLWEDAN